MQAGSGHENLFCRLAHLFYLLPARETVRRESAQCQTNNAVCLNILLYRCQTNKRIASELTFTSSSAPGDIKLFSFSTLPGMEFRLLINTTKAKINGHFGLKSPSQSFILLTDIKMPTLLRMKSVYNLRP